MSTLPTWNRCGLTEGAGSIALVPGIRQQITLPPEYTAMSGVAPNCTRNPPSD